MRLAAEAAVDTAVDRVVAAVGLESTGAAVAAAVEDAAHAAAGTDV